MRRTQAIHWRNKENVEKLKHNWRAFTTVLKHYSDLATSTIFESIPADENPEYTENVNKLYSRGKDRNITAFVNCACATSSTIWISSVTRSVLSLIPRNRFTSRTPIHLQTTKADNTTRLKAYTRYLSSVLRFTDPVSWASKAWKSKYIKATKCTGYRGFCVIIYFVNSAKPCAR